jgi:hypothetical protein
MAVRNTSCCLMYGDIIICQQPFSIALFPSVSCREFKLATHRSSQCSDNVLGDSFQHYKKLMLRDSGLGPEVVNTGYWLLLRGGIVQSVPCTAAIFWSTVRSQLSFNHPRFIQPSSLANTSRDKKRDREKLGEKCPIICRQSVSRSYSAGILNML